MWILERIEAGDEEPWRRWQAEVSGRLQKQLLLWPELAPPGGETGVAQACH